jgi:hypothetical protein
MSREQLVFSVFFSIVFKIKFFGTETFFPMIYRERIYRFSIKRSDQLIPDKIKVHYEN